MDRKRELKEKRKREAIKRKQDILSRTPNVTFKVMDVSFMDTFHECVRKRRIAKLRAKQKLRSKDTDKSNGLDAE